MTLFSGALTVLFFLPGIVDALSYGNVAFHRLDKRSLRDASACLQVHQENKS